MTYRPLLLVILTLTLGCGQPDSPPPGKAVAKKGHAHDEEGPHGGVVTEWGNCEYHLEFVVDHKAQEATVYVFGSQAHKPKAIAVKSLTLTLRGTPPTTVELVAQPLAGDPPGTSTRFVGKHPALGEEKHFAGSISGTLDGKAYAGDFKETGHAGHKH